MKKLLNKINIHKMVLSFAFLISLFSSRAVCFFYVYQPEEPETVKKLNRVHKTVA